MAQHIEITQMEHQVPLLDQTSVNEATEYEIEERREVDHPIEIKETKGEDQSGIQTNTKSANQIFDEMFEDLDNSSIKSCTIFKVNVGLRESNLDAYTPKMISIGPYHKRNPQLRPAEKYKLMCLRRFLQRKLGLDVESCLGELEELKEEALKCYDDMEDIDSNNSTDQFLQMLLLDGSFVVELIRDRHGMCPEGENDIFNGDSIYNQIIRDLLLLENQLPFFVLNKLHHMTKQVHELPFAIMVKSAFLPKLPKWTPASVFETEYITGNVKHVLHLLHMSCHANPRRDDEHSRKNLACNPLQIIRSKEKPKDKDHNMYHKLMPNATELSEAGVSFAKVGYIYKWLDEDNLWDSTSLFDIKFENGLMKIPSFQVVDLTETLLRNLIAYEQQSSDVRIRYFSDFAIFMDCLIDSAKDVSLLRLNGIILNRIGEDNEVARFFNKIGKGVTLYHNFYYQKECTKAVQHCGKPWNRMKANLRRNYFSSPWQGASTLAAIVLLILTAMQTVLAFTGGVK